MSDIDSFIQFDPGGIIPKNTYVVFFVQDIIPYVIEWDYFWGYQTSRKAGCGIYTSLNNQINRWSYIKTMETKANLSDKVLVNSEVTKNDLIKNTTVKKDKIRVIYLGVHLKNLGEKLSTKTPKPYLESSWGYIKSKKSPKLDKPYILYVGGADKRRKLEDLIACFNIIRAQGHELNLILAGDTMKGPNAISNEVFRSSLLDSSYLKDIVFMGFVNNDELKYLYKNALCFVFPSRYEGFGLTVLEAMSYGVPVISYPNTATKEVVGNKVIYATNILDIVNSINELLLLPKSFRDKIVQENIKLLKMYSWKKTVSNILHSLE